MFAYLNTIEEKAFAFISSNKFCPYNTKGDDYHCPEDGLKVNLDDVDTDDIEFEEGSHGEELDTFFEEYLIKKYQIKHIWVQEADYDFRQC